MNIFLRQNNETEGPFDEGTVREMLDSGRILLLTFARLEGEAGWRPLSEIISVREKPPQPVAIPSMEPRRPPPLVENRESREAGNGAVAGRGPAAPPPVEAEIAMPPNTLKIACSNCGQHILVDRSHAGMTGACPTCGSPVTVPATPPAPRHSASHEAEDEFVFGEKRGLAYRLTGLRPLEGFKISLLFADVFKNRSKPEFDSYFTCGSPSTTPDPARMTPDLPRPWFYLRMLIFGGLILLALCFGYEKFPDPKFLPGLMIVGAFLVPLCCVTFFFELNIPRDISIYQVAKLLFGGAVLCLPVVLFVARHAGSGFFRTILAGLAIEIAQVLVAVALLRA